MSAALTMQTCFHDFSVTTLKYHTRYLCYVRFGSAHLVSWTEQFLCVHSLHRTAVTSLQRAGGVYGLVALSPSVGTYAGGRFTSNVPIRVVQPATHPNNSLNLKTEDNCNPSIKEEGQSRRRQRQAAIPAVTTTYQAEVGAWQGTLRVTVCWRELLFTDATGGEWVKSNLLY
jgi:hypothetical protein